jgi:hypothetical protein
MSVYLLCLNEEILIDFTINYYKRQFPGCKITICDNESTDKSVEIAKNHGCEIYSFAFDNKVIDENKLASIKNTVWKSATTPWIIICDMDEFLTANQNNIIEEDKKGTTILKTKGYQIYGNSQKEDLSDIKDSLDKLTRAEYSDAYSKSICFNKTKITDINFHVGAHNVDPKGDVKYSEKVYLLYHYKRLGYEYYKASHIRGVQRTKLAQNKGKNIIAVHYTNNINRLKNNIRSNKPQVETVPALETFYLNYNAKGGDPSVKIDNIAMLIPVYPKHYTEVYALLNKLKNNNIYIDIYCIFSNKEDYASFEMKDLIKEIIPESVPDDNSIVSFKKLYGLKYMINTLYDFIIVCDSETDIIPENFTKDNMTRKINDIFTNKKLYGINVNKYRVVEVINDIIRTCANVFTGEDYKKIESATNNLTLYTFFYNIPVYKREHIQGFLDKIKYDTLKIAWGHFDTLMYDYYLVITQNFEILDVTLLAHDPILSGLYVDNIENLKKLKDLGLGFGSVVGNFWRDKHDILKGENTFLLVNIDRK